MTFLIRVKISSAAEHSQSNHEVSSGEEGSLGLTQAIDQALQDGDFAGRISKTT
jgi:hypothetical protein